MLRPDDVSVHLRSLLRFCARGLDASCSSVLEFAKNCVSFVRVLELCSAPAASVWRPAPYTSFPVRMRRMAHDTHRDSFLDEHAWPLICGIRRCEKEGENVLKFPGNVTALVAPFLPLLCLAFPPSPADTAAFHPLWLCAGSGCLVLVTRHVWPSPGRCTRCSHLFPW